jgi:hypothetical protein
MDFYEIRAHPYTFHAIVQTPKRGGTWRIQIGGAKICVIFNIENEEGEKIAYLEGLSYYPSCSIDDQAPLLRGTGTLRLFRAAITFIYTLFPDINSVLFTDDSSIECDIASETYINKKISLQVYYLAKKGATWYEDKVSAHLNEDHQSLYILQKQKALGNYCEKNGFSEFQKKYMRSVINAFSPDIVEVIENAYTTHSTYKDMFAALINEYDCAIFYGWLEKYFRKHMPLLFAPDINWIISRTRFMLAQISFSKIMQPPAMKPLPHFGGKKTTNIPKIKLHIYRRTSI